MRWLPIVLVACSPSTAVAPAPVTDASTDVLQVDASQPTACDLATTAKVETALSIKTGRYAPGQALLAGDHVLLAGGYDFTTGATITAEDIQPLSGSTALVQTKLRSARNFPASVTFADGSTLFAGGFNPSLGSVAVSDVYAGGAFVAAQNMTIGREAHVATLLGDGRALVSGGLQANGFKFHQTAEIYDPNSKAFTPTTNNLTIPRAFHAAAWFDSSQVVVLVGGASGPSSETATSEMFDPKSGMFTAIASTLPHASKALAAARLPDGRLLIAGGANGTDKTLADATLYDAKTNALTPTAPMTTRRMAFTLTTLADGRVLAVGGWSDTESPSQSTASLEVYDPKTSAWTKLDAKLSVSRLDHVAVLMSDCRVAILGGQSVATPASPIAPLEVELITVPTKH